MSLKAEIIDRLFSRLGGTYGSAWERQIGSVPVSDVKSAWAHELAGFADKLGMLAWALDNLPERCPNVIEFKNLARRAPVPEAARLPEPKAAPERVAAELQRLAPALASARCAASSAVDHKAWAKLLIARHDAGERLTPTCLRFAREALGVSA